MQKVTQINHLPFGYFMAPHVIVLQNAISELQGLWKLYNDSFSDKAAYLLAFSTSLPSCFSSRKILLYQRKPQNIRKQIKCESCSIVEGLANYFLRRMIPGNMKSFRKYLKFVVIFVLLSAYHQDDI